MSERNTARPELRSARLLLRAPSSLMTPGVGDFQLRNRAHFAPWDPDQPASYFEAEAVAHSIHQGEQAWAADSAYCYWLSPLDAPAHLIGKVQVTQIARGPFQNAMLGYKLDAASQGLGLMFEALQTVVAEMFAPGVRLHRLQAAVRPENHRSLALLQRLGFESAGLSRRYLFINGAWRDHEVFALINPDWADDQAN